MSDKIKPNLLAILDAAQKIQQFTASIADADAFFNDVKTFDAVLMNFIVIGEAANRLPASFLATHTYIPWRKIAGFRNIIAHNYFGVDADEVWEIVQAELPVLAQQILDLPDTQQR